jgi:hypothetical protein
VRVTVVASGVCHADIGTAAAPKASASAPVTPGHEVAGIVAELGEDVEGWAVGERAGVGWFGGSCGHCDFCRAGDVVHCPQRLVPGLSYPGGWAEMITVPAGALARIPDGLDLFDAAPMGWGRPAALFGFASAIQFEGTPPEQIAAAFARQLGRLFGPDAAQPRAVHVTDWSREQHTTPRAPSPSASTASYGHPLFQQPTSGRIHWASTETSPAYAGHIEGAIRAGTRAARTITRLAATTDRNTATNNVG